MGSPGGVVETILGEALEGRRDRAVITTKVGNAVGDDNYQGAGLGRGHMMHQIDRSLTRMRTDYVDFFELHKPDPETPLLESVGVMAELVKAGKIRHWGFSNFEAETIREMLTICADNDWPKPVVNQFWYNWLIRDAANDQLALSAEAGIAVTPYRALANGLLSGKYKRGAASPDGTRLSEKSEWMNLENNEITDDIFDQLEAFAGDAAAAGLSPVQYAVQWLLEQPGVSSIVVGARRIEQLEVLLALG
jgi:aryl-alcohol dehydrogenase-like predicted oxidoreductase